MARGINKVILIGNLGHDPEVRFMPSGGGVANLRIATSDTWNDKNTGEKKENTEWHTVVLFNKLAEIAGQYLRKGAKIYIEGSLRTRKWQDKNGQDRYTTEIVGNEMQMLDSRGGSGHAESESDLAGPSLGAREYQKSSGTSKNLGSNTDSNDLDDDIPF